MRGSQNRARSQFVVPVLRRALGFAAFVAIAEKEWGIRSPWWGRSHAGGCSEDPSRPSRLQRAMGRYAQNLSKI